jgi:hypothetical protein
MTTGRLGTIAFVTVAVLLLLGAGVTFYSPRVQAQTSLIPSVVTVGSCWKYGAANAATAFKVGAIEGDWIRTEKGGTFFLEEGVWVNLDVVPIIRPVSAPGCL